MHSKSKYEFQATVLAPYWLSVLPSGGRNVTFNLVIGLVRSKVETMISRDLVQNHANQVGAILGRRLVVGEEKAEKKNLGWVLASSHINLILLGIWNHVTETLVDPCQANLWSWSSGWWMIIAHQSRNSGSSEREGQ